MCVHLIIHSPCSQTGTEKCQCLTTFQPDSWDFCQKISCRSKCVRVNWCNSFAFRWHAYVQTELKWSSWMCDCNKKHPSVLGNQCSKIDSQLPVLQTFLPSSEVLFWVTRKGRPLRRLTSLYLWDYRCSHQRYWLAFLSGIFPDFLSIRTEVPWVRSYSRLYLYILFRFSVYFSGPSNS